MAGVAPKFITAKSSGLLSDGTFGNTRLTIGTCEPGDLRISEFSCFGQATPVADGRVSEFGGAQVPRSTRSPLAAPRAARGEAASHALCWRVGCGVGGCGCGAVIHDRGFD